MDSTAQDEAIRAAIQVATFRMGVGVHAHAKPVPLYAGPRGALKPEFLIDT